MTGDAYASRMRSRSIRASARSSSSYAYSAQEYPPGNDRAKTSPFKDKLDDAAPPRHLDALSEPAVLRHRLQDPVTTRFQMTRGKDAEPLKLSLPRVHP